MAATIDRTRRALHPLNAVLLAGASSLFLAALLSDIAYFRSCEIQWNNFSSWLLAGGLVLAGFAFLCAIIDLFRLRWRVWPGLVYAVLVLVTWILGFIDALYHARDAWATMPASLVLSVIVVVLACVAIAIAFTGLRAGGAS
jgi:uncharacterized membrane protein